MRHTLLAVLTAAALDTAAAINTNENTVGAATVCSQSDTGLFGGPPMPRGGVTRMSTFHSPLPSFQVRIPLQLEEPRKYRKGRRQVPKHRCLLPFYTLDFICLSPSNVLSIPRGFNPSAPSSSHMPSVMLSQHELPVSENGLLVHQLRCSSIFSLLVCEQTFPLHGLSAKGHHPNDKQRSRLKQSMAFGDTTGISLFPAHLSVSECLPQSMW